jgi:hypothetical protein
MSIATGFSFTHGPVAHASEKRGCGETGNAVKPRRLRPPPRRRRRAAPTARVARRALYEVLVAPGEPGDEDILEAPEQRDLDGAPSFLVARAEKDAWRSPATPRDHDAYDPLVR